MANWEHCPEVEYDPMWLGGIWWFRGTRLPIFFLFRHLANGGTVDGFAAWYGLNKDEIVAVLDHEAQRERRRRQSPLVRWSTKAGTGITLPKSNRNVSWIAIWYLFSSVIPIATFGQAMTLGKCQSFHPALIALWVAHIFVIEWIRGDNPANRKFSGLLIAIGSLASAYLWAAKDAGADPSDPTIAWLLTAIFGIPAVFFIALPVAAVIGSVILPAMFRSVER